MRRTYMSKKATANNIDRRDLLQNLDEKCTPYDAFSIQNIKQTKRELSCVGSINTLGIASSRVRKRKYVKRIIKDVGIPSGDSMSHSTNLTPDKSIHVNKTPDPFDLLLMSSPLDSQKLESRTSREDLCFDNLKKKGRKYTRKKSVKSTKMYNNSSTDSSESEKENFNKRHDTRQNTSDIRTHKLLVEQDHNISAKWIDDSINNIVNNLSLLHKLKNSNSINDSINEPLGKNKHQLTRNSVLLKSPLSSTPFKIKYRKAGESIYKFSPIISEEIKNNRSLNIDNDNSTDNLIHLDIGTENRSKSVEKYNIICPQSTLNSVPNYGNERKTSYLELSPDRDTNNELVEEEAVKPQFIENITINITPSIELTSCQSDIEPFLGFSPNENVERNIQNKLLSAKTLNFNDESYLTSKNDSDESKINNSTSTEFKVNKNDQYLKTNPLKNKSVCISSAGIEDEDDNQALIENEINVHPPAVLENTYDNSIHSEGRESDNKITISANNSINSSSQFESSAEVNNLNEKSYISSNHNSFKESIISGETSFKEHEDIDTTPDCTATECDMDNNSNDYDVSRDSLSLLDNEDNDSFYDTCTSEQSFIQQNEIKTEPVVVLQRMNDSIFFRYYNNMKSNKSENKGDDSFENSASDFFSVRGSSCANDKSDTDLEIDEQNDLFNFNTDDYNDNIVLNSDECSLSSNEEEKCMSFVTTRRRNEVTNNSIISIFSNSYNSSSTDCNETVLSNKKGLENSENGNYQKSNYHSDINLDTNAMPNATYNKVDEFKELDINATDLPEQKQKVELVTTEKNNSRTTNENSLTAKNNNVITENSVSQIEFARTNFDVSRMSKVGNGPGIVLKPGKRWERSLSIFRRMTMMTEHLNQSILDEELTKTKGRKYRQSVISTIEMQDLNGSLHNESINSRRSTFVSKPSRSTIRIVKDPNSSRLSLCNTTVFDDLKGFLNEECDDTIIELSKLSIADQSHEVTVLDNFHDTSNRIAAARDYVLRRCNQTDPILFDECYPDALLKNCHKIGEGVYGEVFLWRARDGYARVLKIIPIAGNIKVNGESQKDFHEVISEIVIAMELSALRAPIAEIERHFDEGKDVEALDLHAIENATDVFNEVLAVRCVYGSYPSRLLDLWDLYDECKGSENDNPAILPVDQQYIVLELANAGQDLESYQFNNAEQAHALFLQVAYGLAVAEEAFQFEHRDLHWGNVLISPTDKKYATFVIRGRLVRVPLRGVRGAVIDYSLSRVALHVGGGEAAALYNDLANDDELFDALGDYQFDVYRLMRDKLGNEWKNFEPYTNILWLHYTVDKMITALRYKRTNTKIHKHYIDKLKGIKARILGYGSAAQFVLTDNEI